MGQIAKRDYYELLDLRPQATREEIMEACERALEAFEGESDAVYSLYTPGERESLVQEIKEAREVLLNSDRRRAYDASRGASAPEPAFTAELEAEDLRGDWSGRRAYGNTVRFTPGLLIAGKRDNIVTEQYRILYTKLEHIGAKGVLKTVAVTSSVKGEGKSATSLNLAYVIATEFKRRVLLVECDLRKPSTVTARIGREGAAGLSDVLEGRADAADAVCRVEGTSLHLLAAGAGIKNASELIDSPRLKDLLERFKSEFDYIIIDAPPIVPLMDMNIISRLADGMILVVRAGVTPRKIVLKAVQSISGGRFIGVVLNGAETALSKYYY